MIIDVVETVSELEGYLAPWRELVVNAPEKNIFYEPCLLVPALRNLDCRDVKIVLVWSAPSSSSEKRILTGLFPVVCRRGYRGLPFYYVGMWEHPHCYLCTPLIRMGWEHETLLRFLEWAREFKSGASLVEFRLFGSEGSFAAALKKIADLEGRRIDEISNYERPVVCIEPGKYSGIRSVISKSLCKQIRKKKKGLKEHGAVEFVELNRDSDLKEWTSDFLALEKSGWKGRAGTALDCSKKDGKFFKEALNLAFNSGKISMTKLCLDGKPVAMKCNFISGARVFSFKIAYDERYAKYSPGMILEVEVIDRTFQSQRGLCIDSCALPDSNLHVRIMKDRYPLKYVNISTGNRLSIPVVYTVKYLRGLYHACGMGGETASLR